MYAATFSVSTLLFIVASRMKRPLLEVDPTAAASVR
jgi:hypothetical protein